MILDAKANITVVDKNNDVVAVITKDKIITFEGYDVLFDVGTEDIEVGE